jgi:hypothetical protein
MHPVFERPFGGRDIAVSGGSGCFRGRPLGRLATGVLGEVGVRSSGTGDIFTSSSSPSSSIFGTISSLVSISGIARILKLNLLTAVVFLGDSLEDCDPGEEELTLILVCEMGGAGPNITSVAILRSGDSVGTLRTGDASSNSSEVSSGDANSGSGRGGAVETVSVEPGVMMGRIESAGPGGRIAAILKSVESEFAGGWTLASAGGRQQQYVNHAKNGCSGRNASA